MAGEFGLSVRFTLKEGTAAAFDALVAETLIGIRESEPGTLIYVNQAVDDEPSLRIFYELYRDREAFDQHERQPHTRKFLAGREALVDHVEVDWLTAVDGKGYTQSD
jgi:quinol monooxygenase YgiN